MIGALISTFMEWWWNQIISIANQLIMHLHSIQLSIGLTLMEFIVTITIISTFMGIVLNSTRLTGNKIGTTIERKKK